ncbi:MAG: carboxypeptidase-like regulatory domain-containing protein [Bryobacteraceae bacterium]|nr:carboxypeptidase-like regulatory domain-containing protein [Bryobacteraceae bacterium]
MRALFVTLLAAWGLCAAPPEPCLIEGTVLHHLTGQPLPRTRIAIERLGSKGPAAAATTTDDGGRFRFDSLTPGFYALTAARDGFLPMTVVQEGGLARQSLALWLPGQRITGVTVRLRPAGVIAGRVRFQDGESALGVPVQVWRQQYVRGRRTYAAAGTVVTNDLGEYRLHSLPPGAYFVAAIRQPPPPAPGVAEPEDPGPQPVSTFYTAATRLGEGTAVQVGLGQEVSGVDIYLAQQRTRTIRGKVVNAVNGRTLSTPTIALRWLDPSGAGSIPAPVRLRVAQGVFEIAGVTPGTYMLTVGGADDGRVLTARHMLTVTDADIENLEIAAAPARLWTGQLRFDKQLDDNQLPTRVIFEPRSDLVAPLGADIKKDGSFALNVMPDETYDVFVEGGSPDAYLKSALIGADDLLRDGFSVSRADKPETIELVMTRNAARVSGKVYNAGSHTVSGANVALLPQPLQSRLQGIKAAATDENGDYQFNGVAPGRYLLLAWVAEPPCDLFDPALPAECTQNARAIEVVNAGDVSGVRLRLNGQPGE